MANGIRTLKSAKTGKTSFEAWVWSKRDNRKIRKTFSRLDEAKRWRTDETLALRTQATHAKTAPGLPTIRAASEKFIADAEAGIARKKGKTTYKPSTVRGYARDLRERINPDFGPLRLDELSRRDVKALVARLLAEGLQGQSVRNVVTSLQAMYRYFEDLYEDDVSYPARGIDLPDPGAGREHWAKASEAADLLAAIPPEDRAAWGTALFCGLRLGELRSLRVLDVDLEAGTLSVERGFDVKVGVIAPKSRAGIRTVPIPATLAAILRAHVERTGRTGEDLIFGRSPSEPFTDSWLRTKARRSWDAENLKRRERGQKPLQYLGFQEARHSYRSYLSHVPAIDPVRAGSYFGHSDTSVTARYTHWSDEELARDAQALDAYLTGNAAPNVVPLPVAV
jgi:integrase